MAIAERFQGANAVDAGRRSPYWGEHAARYVFAAPYAAGRSVLDIACGTGYGLGLLAKTARFVAGVDVDPEAARTAAVEAGPTAAVILGDGLRLPFPDASFDVITSFETLEHLHRRAEFLAELRRVLAADGHLLLSTPNADLSRSANPFHIHEYTPDELVAELDACFEVERFLGQTLDPASGIPPFYDAQLRLPRDAATQLRLFGWKLFNKIPFAAREALSEIIWSRPFYPGEMDYNFEERTAREAVTFLAVCRKR